LSAIVALLVVAWAATSTVLYRMAVTSQRNALASAEYASQNALLAEHNAQEANARAQEALANALTARRNAERASASETLARTQEQAAKQIAQDAIAQMINLGEQVMRRLKAKHDPAQAEAQWLRLRDDLLAMLRKEMVPIAERIEGQQVSAFAFATMHQRLGDLFQRLGQVDDARREFQQGYDVIARVAKEQPSNDVARANLGVLLFRFGDMALEQAGDAARARDEYDRAWMLQEEIALHPRSGNYSKSDNQRILSGIAIKQGIAELGLGHLARARDRFQKALELRQAWTETEPQNVSAESYKSEAELWLGVALSRLGDWPGASRHLDRAFHICESLAARYPGNVGFQGDIASVREEQGAALARNGRQDEAEKALNQSLVCARVVLARDPEDVTQRLVTAAASDWLAAFSQMRGMQADAERLWRAALEIRTDLARSEPQNVPAEATLCIAISHSGRCDEAMKKAEQLFKTYPDRPAVLLRLARCFAACVTRATTDADRRRARALAQDALAAAIHNGYRDPVAIRTDPDIAPLLADPAFKNMVDGIKP
jgi:tetratricopeptide (TPR) repeat protein